MSFLTYFDLVENLIVSSFGGPQDAEQRDIRTAVQRAYGELTTINEWSYYQTHGRIITQEAYSTGTVAYDSSTRQLTLTGGTWPAWAKFGSVAIGRLIADVAERTSDTVLTMGPTITYAGNYPAGQAYVLFRTDYPLPSDFRNMDEPSNEYNWWSGLYLRPDEAMKLERVGNRSGRPWHWTILKDPDGSGYVLKLVGYPTSKETLDFTYRRYPRAIKYSGHEAVVRAGTITAAGASITGSSTTFPADVAGSVLRVGTAADHPQTLSGMVPYSAETKILSRASTTSLATADSVEATACKYLITDPADVGRHMQTALYSACEYWLARIRGVKPDDAFGVYQRDLRLAMEQDQLAPLSGRTREIWHDGGWRSPLKADEGV